MRELTFKVGLRGMNMYVYIYIYIGSFLSLTPVTLLRHQPKTGAVCPPFTEEVLERRVCNSDCYRVYASNPCGGSGRDTRKG